MRFEGQTFHFLLWLVDGMEDFNEGYLGFNFVLFDFLNKERLFFSFTFFPFFYQ